MKLRNGNYDIMTDAESQENGEPHFSITMFFFKVGAVDDTSKNAILTIRRVGVLMIHPNDSNWRCGGQVVPSSIVAGVSTPIVYRRSRGRELFIL